MIIPQAVTLRRHIDIHLLNVILVFQKFFSLPSFLPFISPSFQLPLLTFLSFLNKGLCFLS